MAKHYVSDHAESMILPLWFDRKNTNEIAKALGIPEFEIANRLSRLRDASKGEPVASGDRWTAEMDAELKSYYDRRFSSSQIAGLMGQGLSRNAIIGRIHRTGLNGAIPTREPTTRAGREEKRLEREARRSERETRKNDRRRSQRQQFRIDNPHPKIEETQLRCVEIEPRNITLMDLEPNDCRYPYGGWAEPILFCGHPKFGESSYCGPHHFLSVGVGTSSERAASRISNRILEST